MLNKEVLTASDALKELTLDQINVIAELSQIDENQTVKRIHDQYDADVLSITGNPKPGGVKSYQHLKDELNRLKSAAESAKGVDALKGQIESLQKEKNELQSQIKAGAGDVGLKNQVESLERALKDKDSEITQIKTSFDNEVKTLSEQLKTTQSKAIELQLTQGIDSYLIEKGIKFKSTIPEAILNDVLKMKRHELLNSVKVDQIDDGQGGKKTVLRGQDGEILRDKENGLNPISAGKLFVSKVSDLIDEGRQQTGTGATGSNRSDQTVLDLSSAKTQIEADRMIEQHILTNEGIAKIDPKFGQRQAEIRNDSQVNDLPIR